MSIDATAPPMLELTDVSVAYGQQVAVRHVDLVVNTGAVTALLGPNGAGKTTLLRAVAGLARCSDGQVRIEGADATGYPAHRRAKAGVCLIPEGRGIFRSLSVAENMQAFAKERRADTDEAFAAFPALTRRRSQIAGTMSGGEQQMLALARCFLAKPKVILLDEVSMGLAPLVVDQIFESIARIAEAGISLLIVEQYIDRALDLASQAYVLNHGDLVFAGNAADLSREDLLRSYLGGAPDPA